MVNAEKNAGRLEKAPHMKFLDLAAVYRVVVGNGSGSIMVSRSLCDKFAITEDELDAAARRNTEKAGFSVRPLWEILSEVGELMGLPEDPTKTDIWVITNATGINGAAAMLYSDCLHSLAEQIGDDLYILPSSIHELLAVPAKGMDLYALRDKVCLINANEVAADEVLSNNVYWYSRRDGTLSIA